MKLFLLFSVILAAHLTPPIIGHITNRRIPINLNKWWWHHTIVNATHLRNITNDAHNYSTFNFNVPLIWLMERSLLHRLNSILCIRSMGSSGYTFIVILLGYSFINTQTYRSMLSIITTSIISSISTNRWIWGYNWTVNGWIITVANWKEFCAMLLCACVCVYVYVYGERAIHAPYQMLTERVLHAYHWVHYVNEGTRNEY